MDIPTVFEQQLNEEKREQIVKNIKEKFGDVVLTFLPSAIGIYALNVR